MKIFLLHIILIFAIPLAMVAQPCIQLSSTITPVQCNGLSNGNIIVSMAEPNIVLDGNIGDAAWGVAKATSAGGPGPGFGAGHELNAIYTYVSSKYLYIGIAGNVQDQNRILLFIDSKTGGFNNGSFDRTNASFGLFNGNFNSGITFDPGFTADYCLTLGTNSAQNNYFLDLFTLASSAAIGINRYLGDTSYNNFSGYGANSNNTQGWELRIPWDSIGGLPTQAVQLFAIYQADNGFMSNQFLTPANNGESNYGNNPVDFGQAAPNPISIAKLSINWNTGDTTFTISNKPAGTYTITVSNSTTCTFTTTYTITEPNVLAITANATAPMCHNDSAYITIGATGGTINYTGTGNYTVPAGNYTYTIVDANNCQASTSLSFTNPPLIKVGINQTPLVCYGDSSTVTIIMNGGVPPYTGTGTFTLPAGTYNLPLVDAAGCSTIASFTITNPPQVIVTATPSTQSICNGSNTIIIASGALTYNWQGVNINNDTLLAQPAANTIYTVTGYNAAGCRGTTTASVSVSPPPVQLALATANNVNSISGNECSQALQADGTTLTYFDANCQAICTITDSIDGTSLGNVQACVTIYNNGTPVYLGQPYIARSFSITAQQPAATTITMYCTDADFILYNTNRGTFDSIPTHVGGNTIAAIAVTKVSNGTLGAGTALAYSPLQAVWDAGRQHWAITFSTIGFSEFYLHTVNLQNAPLAIQQCVLNAMQVNNTIQLNWQLLSNTQPKAMHLYKLNSALVFEKIYTGNTQHYLDDNIAPNNTYQVLAEYDNNKVWSNIISVNSNNKQAAIIYPNPTNCNATITWQSLKPMPTYITIYNSIGGIVFTQQVLSTVGTNKLVLPSCQLSNGVYSVQVHNTTLHYKQQFVKQ
jgi:hypothetical protein